MQAFDALGAQNWAEQVTANSRVATAFWPLSPTLMSQVIYHAYLQTMLNLHLKFGTPLRVPELTGFRASSRVVGGRSLTRGCRRSQAGFDLDAELAAWNHRQ